MAAEECSRSSGQLIQAEVEAHQPAFSSWITVLSLPCCFQRLLRSFSKREPFSVVLSTSSALSNGFGHCLCNLEH